MTARNLSRNSAVFCYHLRSLICDATKENGDHWPALADRFALRFNAQPWLRHGECAGPPKRAFAFTVRHYTRVIPVRTQLGVMS